MVVKESMDICLNVTGNAGNSKNETPQINNEVHIKRLKKSPSVKNTKPFQKFQSTESSKSLLVGAKKRIKQKSLATIVANNLKKANQSKEVSQISILKKNVTSKKKSSNVPSNAVSKKAKLQDKKVNFLEEENKSNEPLIAFTKPTKENAVKTILARKRKNNTSNLKKSLSSIFKTSESVDKKLLKPHEQEEKKTDKVTNEQSKIELMQDKSNVTDTVPLNSKSNFTKKLKKSKDKMENNSLKFLQKGGKISSLFGNNPTVPTIGQRFVKPISEKVFSAEKFNELGIHAFSVSNLEQNMQITTMTTVQKKAIPIILKGSDILIRSQTGSGKTLTYALPIIETLQAIRPKLTRSSGIKALVIVPTRELALQTYECFLKLIKPFTWVVPGYLTGGEKRKAEKARLRKGCTVLVATPGRLLDHIKHTKALRLDSIKCLVLDEADRMLDMGYEKDISEIVAALQNAPSDNSGYNALELLRQHIKPKNDSIEECKMENDTTKEQINVDEEENITESKEYHSYDEESDDESKLNTTNTKSNNKTKPTEKEENSNSDKLNTRQTILLSATLTQAVEKLAGLTMSNPIFVDAAQDNIEAAGGSVCEINEDLVVPQSVIQSYIVTPPKLRMVTLSAYITGKCQSQGNHKILIFMATQDMIDYHTEILSSILNKPIDDEDEESDSLVDVEFFKLHGNMSQKERTEVFKTFRESKSGVLLCTDVAARGLDLPKVDTVIQYTGPTSTRDYVHRIGRTARAGCSGTATIFLSPPEVQFIRMLEARRIRIKQDNMDDVLSKLLGPFSTHTSVQAAAIALQDDCEKLVLENKKLHVMACKAYTSWVRFYSSYPREMREVFNRKDLHLGHYAKSFALRDPPQKIGVAGKSIREREDAQQSKPKHQNRLSNQREDTSSRKRPQPSTSQRQQDRNTGMLKNVRMLNTSEYGSGLEPIKKPKKS